jgi:hypothetical protein
MKSAKAGDLLIEQPSRFYLTVYLKTAKTIGIEVPTALLLRADEVIEKGGDFSCWHVWDTRGPSDSARFWG